MKNKYYVYGVYSEDELIYIGKGCGDRLESHLTGRSSSVLINERFFRGEELTASKFASGLTKNRALLREAQLINSEKPCCNVIIPKITEELYLAAVEDLKIDWNYERCGDEQEDYLVEEGSNPLVWVKRSPNYEGLSHLRFPTQLPLKWCGTHYRLEGKDLTHYDYDFTKEDNINIDESLYIPPYCI